MGTIRMCIRVYWKEKGVVLTRQFFYRNDKGRRAAITKAAALRSYLAHNGVIEDYRDFRIEDSQKLPLRRANDQRP